MIAAEPAIAVAGLVHRRTPEFTAPDDEGVVEQPARFQVLDQRRRRLIHLPADIHHPVTQIVVLGVAVAVPTPVIQLHEAYAFFDQPPREQAVRRETGLARLGAIQVEHVLRFLRDIHQLRHARLHAIGHLVLRDAGQRLGIAHAAELVAVQRLQGIERLPAQLGVHAVGIGKEQHGITLRAQRHALVNRWQKPAAPKRCPAVGSVRARHHHDEARQVVRLRAETVTQPRAHARPAEAR